MLEWLLARAGQFAEEADVSRYLNQMREGGSAYDHITSTKDVFALQYSPATADAAPVATDAEGGSDAAGEAPLCCPITALRCDVHPFVALRRCGHVMAERAVKEAGRDGTCPLCGAPFSAADHDVVPLVPSPEQAEDLRALLPGRRKKKEKRQGKGEKRQRGEEAAEQQQQSQQKQPRQQQGDGVQRGQAAGSSQQQAESIQ